MTALLMDIDGVLIRDKKLLKHVSDNCVRYVRTKLPMSKTPEEVNRIMYLAYGHTGLGLRQVFGIDTADFDSEVYDDSLMGHLANVLYSKEFQNEAADVYEFTQKGWDLTLFTNSPEVWARPVALAIGDNVKYKCPGTLKPLADAYISFPKNRDYVFVDDSLKNLGTVRWLPNWKPVLFGTECDFCPAVRSMWELSLYLATIKL